MSEKVDLKPVMDEAKPTICTLCNVSFPSRSKLFAHLRKEHTNQEQVPTVDPIVDFKTLSIAFEDESCRVIVKPQGLSTMGHKGLTVLNHPDLRLVDCNRSKAIPCHRLDKETGGLLICAKGKIFENIIPQCFRFKWVKKKYIAVVAGRLEPESGEFTSDIKSKPSKTMYRVASYTRSVACDWITTVELWPITGRRHQLRKHLAQAGHPIIGDKRYSHAETWPKESQCMFLWAVEISLPSPLHLVDLFEKYSLFGAQTIGKRSHEEANTSAADKRKDGNGDEREGDDDDDEEEEEGSASSISEEVLQALLKIPTLTISIPEPHSYQRLRDLRNEEYLRSQSIANPLVDSSLS